MGCSGSKQPEPSPEVVGDDVPTQEVEETSGEEELIALKMIADAEHASFEELEGVNDTDDELAVESDTVSMAAAADTAAIAAEEDRKAIEAKAAEAQTAAAKATAEAEAAAASVAAAKKEAEDATAAAATAAAEKEEAEKGRQAALSEKSEVEQELARMKEEAARMKAEAEKAKAEAEAEKEAAKSEAEKAKAEAAAAKQAAAEAEAEKAQAEAAKAEAMAAKNAAEAGAQAAEESKLAVERESEAARLELENTKATAEKAKAEAEEAVAKALAESAQKAKEAEDLKAEAEKLKLEAQNAVKVVEDANKARDDAMEAVQRSSEQNVSADALEEQQISPSEESPTEVAAATTNEAFEPESRTPSPAKATPSPEKSATPENEPKKQLRFAPKNGDSPEAKQGKDRMFKELASMKRREHSLVNRKKAAAFAIGVAKDRKMTFGGSGVVLGTGKTNPLVVRKSVKKHKSVEPLVPQSNAAKSLASELNMATPVKATKLIPMNSHGAQKKKSMKKSIRAMFKSTRKRNIPVANSDAPKTAPTSPKRKPGAVTVAEIDAGLPPGDLYEELDERAVDAARWTDKVVVQLIGEIQNRGTKNAHGQYEITFGKLFDETANIFDALVGIIKTAKKYHVVHANKDQLWQGQDDNEIITLLKDNHSGVLINRRLKTKVGGATANAKTKGFGATSLANQNQKCHKCGKTVYPMEFVGASDKAFHKNCFRCKTCNCVLKPNDYCNAKDEFYCPTHFKELINLLGGAGNEAM